MKKVYRRRYKKRRIPRPIKSNEITCCLESYTQVGLPASLTELRFTKNSSIKYNLLEIIDDSVTFSKFSSLYARMKIVGLSITTSPCKTVDASIYPGVPDCCIGLFPNLTSATNVALANEVIGVDNAHYFQPSVTVSQSKYWKFRNNFFEGSDGTGLGVYFGTEKKNSLSGQIVVGSCIDLVAQTTDKCIANVRFKLYVVFSDKIF